MNSNFQTWLRRYDTYAPFHEYVDKYCKKHEIGVMEALRHQIVKEVYIHLKEQEKGKISEIN